MNWVQAIFQIDSDTSLLKVDELPFIIFSQQIIMSSYKLTYFNGGGRGETTRLIFHVVGQAFVDNRIEFSEWPKLKPSKCFFSFIIRVLWWLLRWLTQNSLYLLKNSVNGQSLSQVSVYLFIIFAMTAGIWEKVKKGHASSHKANWKLTTSPQKLPISTHFFHIFFQERPWMEVPWYLPISQH